MDDVQRVRTVAIYARESHGEDEETSISVGDQVDTVTGWAAREGWTVSEVIRDVGSASRGSRRRRSRFAELLAVVEAGEVNAVLAWEQSRFARSDAERALLEDTAEDAGVLLGYGGRLYDMGKTDDRLTSGITGVVSAAEARRTGERIRRRTEAAAKEGRVHGKHLYGFTREYADDPKTGKRVCVAVKEHPEQGPVVRRIFRETLAGQGTYSIARGLNRDGIPPRRPSNRPRRDQVWTPDAVRELLRNPAYAGRRVFRGEVIGKAKWKGMVTDKDFDKVQRIMATRSTPDKGRRPVHLLSGIAQCEVCGSGMVVMKQNGGRRKLSDGSPNPKFRTYTSYMCAGHRGATGFHVAMKEEFLDELVVAALLARLSRPDFLAHAETDDGRVDEQRAELLAEIDRYTAYLDRVREQAAEALDMSVLFDQEKRIKPKIEAAQKALERLVGADPAVMALAGAADVRTAWEGLDLDARRAVLKATLTPVVRRVGKGHRGRKGPDPERVEIRWHTGV